MDVNSMNRASRFGGVCLVALSLSLGLPPAGEAAELPCVSTANGFHGFLGSRNAMSRIGPSGLVVTEIGRDPQLKFRVPHFTSVSADRLVVRYRAKGTSSAPGELYYSDGTSAFSDDRRWFLSALKADGAWHEMVLSAGKACNAATWRKAGLIREIRLDPVNGEGGEVEIAEIRFENSSRAGKAAAEEADPKFLAAYGAPPWPQVASEIGKKPVSTFRPHSVTNAIQVRCEGGQAEPCRAVAGSKVRFSFDFAGEVPAFPFWATLTYLDRETVAWENPVLVCADSYLPLACDRWRLSFEQEIPLYMDTRKLTVLLSSEAILPVAGELPEASLVVKRVAVDPDYDRPVESGVCRVAGIPRFSVGGKPLAGLWGTSSWRPDRSMRHSGAPCELATVWPLPRAWWPMGEELDTAALDRVAEGARRAYPKDCRFIWSISLYPPTDWAGAHPDDLAQDEQGFVNRDGLIGFTNYSFSSRRARELMARMLEKTIRYLESSPYANRIAGYRIDSGHTYEWLGWNPSRKDTTLDFSPVARQAFSAYLKERALAWIPDGVPGLAERCEMDGQSLFWDQKLHARTIAYHDFYSREVAECMLGLCRRAKKQLGGRKLVGAYYGYVVTLFAHATHMRAHYATQKVLEDGTVDFITSPHAYLIRDLGETRGDMKPFRSLQDHNIVSAIEDDTRTHVVHPVGYSQTPTADLTTAIHRRNMGISLCRGEPYYTMSITDGTDLDTPAFARDASAFADAARFAIDGKIGRNAEIAVVVSEESMKSMPMQPNAWERYFTEGRQEYRADGTVVRKTPMSARPILTDNYTFFQTRLARVGAPVDYLLAEDLGSATGKYRLYVFLNCCKATEPFRRAVAALRERECSLLWLHAPGFVSDKGNSTAGMKDLTGRDFELCGDVVDPETVLEDGRRTGATNGKFGPFFTVRDPDRTYGRYAANGKPSLLSKRTGRATTYFSGSYRLEYEALREIVQKAGVFLYAKGGDPVEANDGFVSIHARFGGAKEILLPRKADVVDVFERRIVARGVDVLRLDMPLHDTKLFYFGDKAAELLNRLEYGAE